VCACLQVSAPGSTNLPHWNVHTSDWIHQLYSSLFCSIDCLVAPCSRMTRSKKFCHLLSNIMELIATNSSWPIADTDLVLCALEDHVIRQSLWNIFLAPQWQFTPCKACMQTQIYLLTDWLCSSTVMMWFVCL